MPPAGLRYTDDFLFNVALFIRQRVNRSHCVNTVDEKITAAKNLVNFGQGMLPWQPILSTEAATSCHSTPSLSVLAFTTVEKIGKLIHTPRPPMNPLHLAKIV